MAYKHETNKELNIQMCNIIRTYCIDIAQGEATVAALWQDGRCTNLLDDDDDDDDEPWSGWCDADSLGY